MTGPLRSLQGCFELIDCGVQFGRESVAETVEVLADLRHCALPSFGVDGEQCVEISLIDVETREVELIRNWKLADW